MDEKQRVIISNANIATLGDDNRYIEKGAIYCEEGIIKEIGDSIDIEQKYPGVSSINMNGLLVLPGNIISHTHMYSSFARGMALGGEPASNFVEILEKLWWRLDKALTQEDIYLSAMVYLIQCIRYGTTTIIDHHASPGFIDESLDILAKAIFEAGIRGALCYEVTDRGGPQEAEAGIMENVRFMEKCKSYPTKFVRGHMGLHASFTISDNTLKKAIEEAKKYNGVIHVHVEEDSADRKDSFEKYGVPVIERLVKANKYNLPLLAIHCVKTQKPEFEFIKNKNIIVVHNPSSNMNNAVGVAPVLDMLSDGITVGLGTDGMSADLFSEMKIFPLLHKINTGDPRTCNFNEIYKTVFINNPKVASLFWKEAGLGAIKVGNYCDIIGLEYISPTPIIANNILGHILFGVNCGMVNTTIVNGQILMKDRIIPHIDEEKIMFYSREMAQKLWGRI